MGGYSVTDPTYDALNTSDDDPKAMLAKIMSPASASSLVGPPPDVAPKSEPGQSTPRTGNLNAAPQQAVPKNRDTGTGYNMPLTGVSNPPNGGVVNSIATPAQETTPQSRFSQLMQRPQQSAPSMPNAVQGTLNGVIPTLPQAAKPNVQGDPLNMQTQADQSRLSMLKNTGSGVSQIQNPFLRGLARVGDVAGSIIAPGIAAQIPGTTLHNQQLIGRQQGLVGQDQAQQTAVANQADIASQQQERGALAKKADALAQVDAPMTPTAEQAAAVGHPEIANLPLAPRTYSAMLVAKQRADSAEAVGQGHDTARVTVGQGNNATSAANNAATNATRLQTSKYGPGNRGAGGTGGASVKVSEPGDLSGVPSNVRSLVQAIGEGREGPAPLGRKDGKEIMGYVSQVYPDYDASQFHNYQATRTEFSKGKTGQGINSFNTALQHLGRMEGNLPNNSSIPALNWLKNTALKETGSAANSPFETDRLAVASEIGKAYKGGILSKEENEQYQNLLDRDASPAQQKSNIGELKGLLAGKLNSYDEQYKTSLPTGATRGFQIISPEASKVLNRGTPAAQPQGAPIPSTNVRVQLKDGTPGHVAKSQLDQFLKDNPGAKSF